MQDLRHQIQKQADELIEDPDFVPGPKRSAYGKDIFARSVPMYNRKYLYLLFFIFVPVTFIISIATGIGIMGILVYVCFVVFSWILCTAYFADLVGPMTVMDYIREGWKTYKQRKRRKYVLKLGAVEEGWKL